MVGDMENKVMMSLGCLDDDNEGEGYSIIKVEMGECVDILVLMIGWFVCLLAH